MSFLSSKSAGKVHGTTGQSSTPGKVMEQLILETVSRHMKDKKVTAINHCQFTKGNLSQPDSHL